MIFILICEKIKVNKISSKEYLKERVTEAKTG